MKKNEIYCLKIEDLSQSGEGIGKVDGYVLFVKDTVIGDLVRVKVMKTGKSYGFAKLIEIIEPSKDRVEPLCGVSKSCGGCQLQAMNYEEQLRFKEKKVRDNLERIGKLTGFKMHPIIGMENPMYYRNKAQFPVGTDKAGNTVIGFYAGRTHTIIESEHCILGKPVNEQILEVIKDFISKYNISPYDEKSNSGLLRHILIRVGEKTKEIMVCLIINGHKLEHAQKLVEKLLEIPNMTSISLNVNTTKNNVILGNEIINLYGNGYITDYIGDVKFQISPLSFFQVNPKQTERLYSKVLEYAQLTGNEVVWDMYCGIGTISLFLAKSAKEVYGVEIVLPAILDARVNASINGFENVEFIVGKAEDIATQLCKEDKLPDVVVVDPPRKGCDEKLLNTIIENAPKRIVYVSCDPATLARDLCYLSDNGYELKQVQPVDMFGHTVHVETVVLMSKV